MDLNVQTLYFIVAGSCHPFQQSAEMQYLYEWDGKRELFAAVVFQQL